MFSYFGAASALLAVAGGIKTAARGPEGSRAGVESELCKGVATMDDRPVGLQAVLAGHVEPQPDLTPDSSGMIADMCKVDSAQAERRELPTPGLGRKPIYWVHLHNQGGTFMCIEAHNQGENHLPNCILPNDFCGHNDFGSGNRQYCKQRLQHSQAGAGMSFSEVERPLEYSDFTCTDEMLYGIMLREPMDGMRSTASNNNFDDVDKENIVNAIETKQEHLEQHTGHKCLSSWDTYQHFDNYATRMLGGAYGLPAGMVTESHLELAKARLRNMSVVLIFGDLANHVSQLNATFHWQPELWDTVNDVHVPYAPEFAAAFTDEQVTKLTEANSLDYELWHYANSLAASLTAAAEAALNTTGTPEVVESLGNA